MSNLDIYLVHKSRSGGEESEFHSLHWDLDDAIDICQKMAPHESMTKEEIKEYILETGHYNLSRGEGYWYWIIDKMSVSPHPDPFKNWVSQYSPNELPKGCTEMLIGSGETIKVGDRIWEKFDGVGTVKSFYGIDNLYCVDLVFDNGKSKSIHPTMFPCQIMSLEFKSKVDKMVESRTCKRVLIEETELESIFEEAFEELKNEPNS